MPALRTLCAACAVLMLMVLCVSAACADSVTSVTARGKAYLTVTAGDQPLYGLVLSLHKGRFQQWDAPLGWTATLVEDWQLVWTTEDFPIMAGGSLEGFMVKATGPGRNAVWHTLNADGETVGWGRLNLKGR